MARCETCYLRCSLKKEGSRGFCGVRGLVNGKDQYLETGFVPVLGVGPIERKGLSKFHPSDKVLSVGLLGCNLHCNYCQNKDIWEKEAIKVHTGHGDARVNIMSPADIVSMAMTRGVIGVAFSHSEPLLAHEFVTETFWLAKKEGLLTIIKTNGLIDVKLFREKVVPCTDAVNIDIKPISIYQSKWLRGCILDNIKLAILKCHVEVSIPVTVDFSEEEANGLFVEMKGNGISVPVHLVRIVPDPKDLWVEPTSLETMYKLKELASKYFEAVILENT